MIKILKKTMWTKMAFLLAGFCLVSPTVMAKIVVYPVPKGVYYRMHNDDFTVKVRQAGTEQWLDLYEYKVKVDMDTNSEASMVQFDFSGKVDVWIQLNNGNLQTVDIRPLSRNIRPKVDGNQIMFTLDRPQKLSIECNGDRLHNLHFFAHALEEQVPDSTDNHVTYFGPGIHEPADKQNRTFKIPSHTTVYLAPGAILRGSLNCDSTENVRICGRGMILETPNGISAAWARNLTVEDIAIINPRYNSMTAAVAENVVIRGLKSFSHQGWGDGLDFYCARHVKVDDVFLRNSDDCIAIYGHRWNYYGHTEDIQVTNSVLWADIAHPVNIGTHGDTSTEGEVIEHILFRNIDVLEHDEDDPDYQGVMALNAGDHNLLRHITFDSIRIEHIQEGQLFHLRVMNLPRYCSGPGRNVEDVTFSHISYNGPFRASVLHGYSDDRKVCRIRFKDIRLNGKRVRKLGQLNLSVGDFVEDVTLER